MSWARVLLGGLLLPLKLYFQPYQFRREVAALAPDLPEYYGLWQARRHWRQPEFRRGMLRLLLQAAVALLWAPLLAGLLAAAGWPMDWLKLASGVAVGVVAGVTAGMAGGLAMSMAMGMTGGVAVGVGGSIALGVAVGVAGSVAVSMAWSIAVRVATGMIIGIEAGVMYGITAGLAGGIASLVIITHLPNLALQLPLSALAFLSSRWQPHSSRFGWKICPVRWDDIIFIPLPGLPTLLASLYRQDENLGRQALAETAAHRHQYKAAYRAWALLAQQDAAAVASLPTLALYADTLDWLKEDTPLPRALRGLLLALRDISRDVAAAGASDSATNRLRRLQTAHAALDGLRKQALGDFAAPLQHWAALLQAGMEQAQREQQQQEPIPQVYCGDGRPVQPGQRGDGQVPFKGRAALFRRLELALGGADGERATYVLYGQRRSGKTSALLQLERRLGAGVLPVFLDMQNPQLGGANDTAGLLHGLAGEVNDAARRRDCILPDLTLRELRADPYPAFGRWLDRLETALASRRLLLCLDEFEALEQGLAAGRFDERLLMALRNIVQHRRQVDVLLSGSHAVEELPPRWASALINTLNLPISYLEEDDARELVERPVADFPAIYRPEATARVLYWSRCQPYLMQLLCQLLVERMNRAGRLPPASWIEAADVDAAVPLALERGGNYFHDLWHGQSGGGEAQRLLDALAAGDGQLSTAALQALNPDPAAMRLLLRREIVERSADGFRLAVPLVGEYVRRLRLF